MGRAGLAHHYPRDPLHQLLTILPMDLRLDTLTQNTALRLYRAPKGSQLLQRLGENWHPPSPNEPPLPTPTRKKAVTTLCALAKRAHPDGPRVEAFPEIPTGMPHWNGRVQLIPKQVHWDYAQVTNALTDSCREGVTVNIYCDAVCWNFRG